MEWGECGSTTRQDRSVPGNWKGHPNISYFPFQFTGGVSPPPGVLCPVWHVLVKKHFSFSETHWLCGYVVIWRLNLGRCCLREHWARLPRGSLLAEPPCSRADPHPMSSGEQIFPGLSGSVSTSWKINLKNNIEVMVQILCQSSHGVILGKWLDVSQLQFPFISMGSSLWNTMLIKCM